MKFLIATIIMFGSSFGFSETTQLPDVVVNQEALGGDILLIKMKDYLIISGKESQEIEKELGTESKKKFTRDIIMSKSVEELIASYNPSNDKPMVQTILKRYADILSRIDSKLTLN
ncbi:MAG: hypothetical protein ACXWRE_10415 [Pseudobdellovibrionaceae bacterium]